MRVRSYQDLFAFNFFFSFSFGRFFKREHKDVFQGYLILDFIVQFYGRPIIWNIIVSDYILLSCCAL